MARIPAFLITTPMNETRSPGRDALTRMRFAILVPVVWCAVALLFAGHLILLESMPASAAFTFAALDWLPWIMLTPMVFWLARRCEFTLRTWGRSLLVHLLGCLLVTLALELEFRVAFEWGLVPRMGPPPFAKHEAPPAFSPDKGPGPGGPAHPQRSGSLLRTPRARMAIPMYWALVAVAHALTYHRRSIERERRALQAEASLAEARLAVLQSQLNPHFLFNTLNTIAQLVHESPAACERMIEGLAQLLRASLAASGRRLIPLREELALADCYLGIQTGRFPDRLTVHKEVDGDVLDRVVPTLLIQPLLENAVLHGVAPHRTPGVVTLRIQANGESGMLIEVLDTGDGSGSARDGEPLRPSREGVGLRNTRERLFAIYGDGAEFSLTRHAAGGVCSRVVIRGTPLVGSGT